MKRRRIYIPVDKCKRCGKCCVVKDFVTGIWRDCIYLDHLKDGTTMCRVYNTRLGRQLGSFQVCVKRSQLKFNIPDCPYNNKIFKPHPAYYKNGKVEDK